MRQLNHSEAFRVCNAIPAQNRIGLTNAIRKGLKGSKMPWARMLAYVTGTVGQELLLRNEYLAAENRILKAQSKGRLLLSEEEKATLTEIAHRLGPKVLEAVASPG